jgi:hypothetical protein
MQDASFTMKYFQQGQLLVVMVTNPAGSPQQTYEVSTNNHCR